MNKTPPAPSRSRKIGIGRGARNNQIWKFDYIKDEE